MIFSCLKLQNWIVEKLSNIKSRQIEMSNIGIFSTIHKSDMVEFEARNTAKESLKSLGELMIKANHYASREIEDAILETCRLFEQLEKKIKEVGKDIEKMKYISELKKDCNFAEVHITEKVWNNGLLLFNFWNYFPASKSISFSALFQDCSKI